MSGLPTQPPRFPPNSLLQYLPAIYSEDPFLGRFLLAFEKLLFVPDQPVVPNGQPPAALEGLIADLATYFDPLAAPTEFLPWLASWTAFTLRFDLNESQQRAFIANVIPLYRHRGTKKNLEKLLRIFTIGTPEISEAASAEHPHFFRVTVRLVYEGDNRTAMLLHQIAIAYAIVELEKPAHTEFELDPRFTGMQIGVHSTVGFDTLLGTIPSGG